MNIVWIVVKIAAYTVILNVIFRQTYNFVFLVWQRPIIWICTVTCIGLANMILAFELSWDPSIVSSAVIFVLILNWPPSIPKGIPKEEANQLINSIYDELGIARGRLKYRFGLISFALFSAVAYISLFAETCPLEGKCVPLVHV